MLVSFVGSGLVDAFPQHLLGGPRARDVAARSRETVVRTACASLAQVFKLQPRKLRRLVTGWHYHNWTADPFARGAYSYVPVGGFDAPKRLAEPLEGTLFFAGEATESTGDNATVHGAFSTGVRAAKEILSGV